MAKIAARNAVVVVSGHNISGESNNAVLTRSAESPEVSAFGNTTRQRLSDNITDVEFRLDGFYNTSPSSTDALFAEVMGSYQRVAFLPQGLSTCGIAYSLNTLATSYEIVNSLSEACTVSATFTGGSAIRGRCAYVSAENDVASSCGVNFIAADSVSYYVMHALSVPTNFFSASVQHSTNDSTWTTYAVHFPITASGIVYTGSTVSANQYRRLQISACGGGTGTILIVFSGSSA